KHRSQSQIPTEFGPLAKEDSRYPHGSRPIAKSQIKQWSWSHNPVRISTKRAFTSSGKAASRLPKISTSFSLLEHFGHPCKGVPLTSPVHPHSVHLRVFFANTTASVASYLMRCHSLVPSSRNANIDQFGTPRPA